MNCPLCQHAIFDIEAEPFKCSHCKLVFKNPKNYISKTKEFERYLTHQNNHNDQGYIEFLNKLINPLSTFLIAPFKAIDFGCGPGPTLSSLLKEKGGDIENFDPYFFNNLNLLDTTYDVVTSSEVVEHFKSPSDDWNLLVSLVKPNGLLGIMTLFIADEIDYKSWWYKNDFTHIVFYKEETFLYLAERFNLDIVFNDHKSVIIFKKREGV